MPWKECHVMDERVRFVARLLDGEKMAVRQPFGAGLLVPLENLVTRLPRDPELFADHRIEASLLL